MKVFKEETYRSEPRVNMTDDMVRITINLTRHEYRAIKQQLIKMLAKVRIKNVKN